MSDCRFGVSPVNYPDPDPDPENIMHSNCILDSAANDLVRHMIFVGNVQKSPIASYLKDLDPSFKFCC